MKITKRQLKKIVKEELVICELFGFGKEKKEKRQEIQRKALKELQTAALKYIDEFKGSEIGPFLRTGRKQWADKVWGDVGVIEMNTKWDKELHTQKHPAHDSIIAQYNALKDIIKKWEQTTKQEADGDDASPDVRIISMANAAPSLYTQFSLKETKMKITKRQLRRIIKEEKGKLQEARPEYSKHMFPDRDPGQWAEETVEASSLELNQILNDWNNNPHLDPDAMRALPKHIRASLDDLFVRVEDVMLKLRGEK